MKTESTRLVAIDVARVLAIVFMIQGHTLDVLLAPEYRHGLFFDAWLFLRGLTAPLFFLLAGVAFTLSTTKHWNSYLSASSEFFRRIRRFSSYIALGYILHFPVKSFVDFPFLNESGWMAWLESDVLQCIGVTLIGLQLLVLASRTPARFALISVLLGTGMIIAAPKVWASTHLTSQLPLWLASYVSGNTGSWFPLFPWSAFVLIGSALGYVFGACQKVGFDDTNPSTSQDPDGGRRVVAAVWMNRATADCGLPTVPLLLGGAITAALGLALLHLFPLPVGDNSPADLWKVSPGFFLSRLGSVGIVLALVGWVTQRIRLPHATIRSIAEESLLIYFVHICILYGCVWHKGVVDYIGAVLSPASLLPWIAVMVISMLVLGWTWNRFKKSEPTRGMVIRYATVILMVAYGLR